MAAALLEFSEVLRSKTDKDKITTSESLLINNCMIKAVRNFFVGAAVSSAVVYRATRRLGRWYSFYLSAGSAMFIGRLVFDRSANASLEEILSIEGSRMQIELASIILRKYQESPSRMQLVHKHFYPEVVFTDLKPEKSLVRWRARNVYVDGTTSERNEDHGDCSDDADVDSTQSSRLSKSNLDHVNTFHGNLDGDLLADPLDVIFSNQELSEEIHHTDGKEFTRRRQPRTHGRARRNRHAHNAETYSPSTKAKLNSLQN